MLKLEPGVWNVYFDRGRAHSEMGQFEPAVADFTQAIACQADRQESWLNRGDVHAALGRWDKAAADYEKATDLGAYQIHHWRKQALAWLAAKKQDRYRSLCARLLKAERRLESQTPAHQGAWMFVLAPDAVVDLGAVVKKMETAHKGHPMDPELLLGMGAVLHRVGRFAEAEQKLQEAIKTPEKKDAPEAMLFLAMAQYRLQKVEKARDSLAQAVKILEQPMLHQADAGASWPERLTGQILRHEAEGLINGKKP
jgi:tetratricopeptide (TPR) repeat protein